MMQLHLSLFEQILKQLDFTPIGIQKVNFFGITIDSKYIIINHQEKLGSSINNRKRKNLEIKDNYFINYSQIIGKQVKMD